MYVSWDIDIYIYILEYMFHKNLLQDCVWSVAPYESESWALSKTEEKRLLDVWNAVLRADAWNKPDTIQNERERFLTDWRVSLFKILKTRRTELIGRILSDNRLLSRIIESVIEKNNGHWKSARSRKLLSTDFWAVRKKKRTVLKALLCLKS